jgi:hypothetical protein
MHKLSWIVDEISNVLRVPWAIVSFGFAADGLGRVGAVMPGIVKDSRVRLVERVMIMLDPLP